MTKRFYSGARSDSGHLGEAARLKRIEIEKGGKLPLSATDRYRRIMKKKLEEHKTQAKSGPIVNLPGAKPFEKKLSKTAERAIHQIAQRKAIKEEKALRRMVVVQPSVFPDAGRLDKKGKGFDLGNNLTLKVDVKTGKIKTTTGWTVGKYDARKKYRTNMIIQDALKKHGAYFIQQKKLQMLQEQERLRQQQLEGNVWGGGGLASQQFLEQHYGGGTNAHGNTAHGTLHQRSGANVNAWGPMSNNVMGTYAENVWGGMVDNVWGGTDSNVWGGLGGSAFGGGGGSIFGSGGSGIFGRGMGGGMANWGRRGWKVWGSGKPGQRNLLKPFSSLLLGVPVIGKLLRLSNTKIRVRSK